jgi:hypothetical protein
MRGSFQRAQVARCESSVDLTQTLRRIGKEQGHDLDQQAGLIVTTELAQAFNDLHVDDVPARIARVIVLFHGHLQRGDRTRRRRWRGSV